MKKKQKRIQKTHLPGEIGKRGELMWTIEDGECLVIRGEGRMRDFWEQEPAPWSGYASVIRKVRVEAGVENIGGRAFAGLEHLREAELGPDVERIGWRAFDGCTGLIQVRHPWPLVHWRMAEEKTAGIRVGRWAFRGTPWQEEQHQGLLIRGDTVVDYLGRERNVVIPQGIRHIAPMAFEGCCLDTVSFPGTLETVGACAFRATGLQRLTLPRGLRRVEAFAFSGNPNLVAVELGSLKTELDPAAFQETPVAKLKQCRYGKWLLGPGRDNGPELRFIRLSGRNLTAGNLRRVMKDGGVVLAVQSYENAPQSVSFTSMYYNWYGVLQIYYPYPYLAQSGRLGETAVDTKDPVQWRRRYEDGDTWLSLSSESRDWLSTEESQGELNYMLRCARKGTGALFVSWDKGNVYGPLELGLAKYWLDTHPDVWL